MKLTVTSLADASVRPQLKTALDAREKAGRSMKRALLITGLLTLVACAALAYAIWGPLYAPEPLRASFSLAARGVQSFSFRPGRTATYFLELHLKEALPGPEMERILGGIVAGRGGAIDVGWSIANQGVVIAEGSSTRYGCAPVVQVGLHPSQLEYLIGYAMIGGTTLLLVGPVFLGLLGVVLYRLATRTIAFTPD